MRRLGGILVTALLLILPAVGQLDDDLDEFSLEEREPMTEAQALERLETALKLYDSAARGRALVDLYDDLQANPNAILPPRSWHQFSLALAEDAAGEELRSRLHLVLDTAAGQDPEPSATQRLNLALLMASAAGGVSAETLNAILKTRPDAKLQWLLPALGRAGGEAELPKINAYRHDDQIIPLNNAQNLRPDLCAAVLGAAFAGDAPARAQVLRWYESDTVDLPRFAGYVQWAIQEGMKPDYRMLDYCKQRLAMAELYLDSLPESEIPTLISQANDTLAMGLIDYLITRMKRTPRGQLHLFLRLLNAPILSVKSPVLRIVLASGDEGQQARAFDLIVQQLDSPQAIERFAAATLLYRHAPDRLTPQRRQKLLTDPSPELRHRVARDLVARPLATEY